MSADCDQAKSDNTKYWHDEETPNYGSTLERGSFLDAHGGSKEQHSGIVIDVNTCAKQLENAHLPNQISQDFDRLNVPRTVYRKDEDSICTPRSDTLPDFAEITRASFWKHPKIKENWRVFLSALGLLIVGIGLITAGIVITIIPDITIQSYVFFIAGIICFIPGAYHVVFVFNAVRGKEGYEFSQIPLFN